MRNFECFIPYVILTAILRFFMAFRRFVILLFILIVLGGSGYLVVTTQLLKGNVTEGETSGSVATVITSGDSSGSQTTATETGTSSSGSAPSSPTESSPTVPVTASTESTEPAKPQPSSEQAPAQEKPVEISEKPAPPPLPAAGPYQSSSLVDGIQEFRYLVVFQTQVILDALLLTQDVPSLTTKIIWVADEKNAFTPVLQDPTAARTFFVAPEQEGTVQYFLEIEKDGAKKRLATYQFTIVSPVTFSADVNRDGKFGFEDLLNLLQNWETFGADATKIMSLILSQYAAN